MIFPLVWKVGEIMYTSDNMFTKQNRLNSFQLSKLHTFEVAARHCSFSLAAEELALTPSAISHRITKLEEELGISLFIRSHRKIILSEEGQRIYESVSRALDALNQDVFDVQNGDVSGLLTVYCRPSFAQCWLVPNIRRFQKLYPSIELKLLTGNENIKLQGDGIDAAIYFDAERPKHLECESLFSETIIPVCTPEYADKLNLRESVEQLRHATLLHDNQAWDYDSNEDEWKVWAHANDLEGIEQYSRMSFDRSDLAVLAAQHGVGIAMGRTSLIEPLLLSGELIAPFPNTEVTCKQHYYVATSPERKSDKVNLFVEWLKGVVRKE